MMLLHQSRVLDRKVSREPYAELDSRSVRAVTIECAGVTDIGMLRATNQDEFLIADLQQLQRNHRVGWGSNRSTAQSRGGKILLVADGVGGKCAGEVASQTAAQAIVSYLVKSADEAFDTLHSNWIPPAEVLAAGAVFADECVRQRANENPSLRGMATTLTAAYLDWPRLSVAHVGDSRCYLCRDGVLEQLTKDQTLAQQLYDAGGLDDVGFERCDLHHIITSAVGGSAKPEVMTYEATLVLGDHLLLCSDGVNAHLDDAEIERILAQENVPASVIGQQLIDEANQRGGRDNITAVVAIAE